MLGGKWTYQGLGIETIEECTETMRKLKGELSTKVKALTAVGVKGTWRIIPHTI